MEAILLQQQLQQQRTTTNHQRDANNEADDNNHEAVQQMTNALHNLYLSLHTLQQYLQEDGSSIIAVSLPQQKPNDYLVNENDDIVTIEWLIELCSTIPSSYLEPIQIVRAIVDAASLPTETQQQAAIFDVLGESDEAMHVLFEIASKLSSIQQYIHPNDIDQYMESTKTAQYDDHLPYESNMVDLEEERRQLLLQEAMDAAQIAAIAQAQVDGDNPNRRGGSNSNSSGTHTVVRTSDKQAIKFAEKAKKRAAQALQRAKDAGVTILDESDLLTVNMKEHTLGDGGLVNRTEDEIWALQQSLLPEGTREYYDHRGLPKDAIREEIGDMERVIIPAKLRDETTLPQKLPISNIMDPLLAQAFDGTTSLNPMQSSTFEIAFHARDNMMVCAPVCTPK
jgi:hypothetical protein